MLQQANAVIRGFSEASPGDRIDKSPSPSILRSDTSMDAFQAIISCESLPAQEKEEDRIAQESFNLLVAAGATTAVVLTTATYHLLVDQNDYLARLKEELEAVMKDPCMRVDVQTLEQLPWLVGIF